MRVGLISDTHGLLREEALGALRGSDLIVHAGDIGAPEILDRLRALAPLIAVKGNIDKAPPLSDLPATAVLEGGGARIYVLHDRNELDLDPAAAGFHAVVSGHSHRPSYMEHNGVHYINPGSAGRRRFRLPITVALLELPEWHVRFIELA